MSTQSTDNNTRVCCWGNSNENTTSGSTDGQLQGRKCSLTKNQKIALTVFAIIAITAIVLAVYFGTQASQTSSAPKAPNSTLTGNNLAPNNLNAKSLLNANQSSVLDVSKQMHNPTVPPRAMYQPAPPPNNAVLIGLIVGLVVLTMGGSGAAACCAGTAACCLSR